MLFDTAVAVLSADSEVTDTAVATPSLDVDRIRGARVLLVEHNEINQEVAMGQLEDAELFVDLAENGEVAVRMVRHNDYDIVLMDMQMPVMDGTEATRAIRSNSRFQTLPIIAMTANAMASNRELCLQAGMNKPSLSIPISYSASCCIGSDEATSTPRRRPPNKS